MILSCTDRVQMEQGLRALLYRIVRIQIDLLSSAPGIQLNKLRPILNYSEVKIRQHNLPLSLPTDVETSWQIGDATGNETHRYSNYRLFEATTTILPASANPTP